MTLRVFIANNITAQLTDADNQVNNQIKYHLSTDVIQFNFESERMTSAQVVETSVTVNNNSPVQDYVHPDDHTQPTYSLFGRFGGFCVMRVIVPQACDRKVTAYPSPKSALTLTSHLGQIATYGTGRWSVTRHKHTCEVAGVLLVFIRTGSSKDG